jgi:hypothetical protein
MLKLNNTIIESDEQLADFVRNNKIERVEIEIMQKPAQEGGKGCQVDDILKLAYHILLKLDVQLACPENGAALAHLQCTLHQLELRKQDREARGVEGTTQN